MSHIHEIGNDFSVDVLVVCNNRVLIRLHEKYGIWIAVGGHIELDEDPNEAAVREVKEEVGLDVILYKKPDTVLVEDDRYKELIPPTFLNIHKINDHHNHISCIYFAKSNTIDVIPENPDDKWTWLTLEEVEKNEIGMDPNMQRYAKAALAVYQ